MKHTHYEFAFLVILHFFTCLPLDYLLCHDDQLGRRRFAFIYYLTSQWNKEDGGIDICYLVKYYFYLGLLELFDCDGKLI